MTSLQHPIFNNIDMGIGTWAWGDKLVWGFGNGYNEGDVIGAFTASIAGGIRFLIQLKYMVRVNQNRSWES